VARFALVGFDPAALPGNELTPALRSIDCGFKTLVGRSPNGGPLLAPARVEVRDATGQRAVTAYHVFIEVPRAIFDQAIDSRRNEFRKMNNLPPAD
jgi:hypothetical protein